AEVDSFVLELHHRNDLRMLLESLHERILDDLAEASREREEPLGRERLIAEEKHEVLEPRASKQSHGLVVEVLGQVEAADLGPEGARHGMDADGAHGPYLISCHAARLDLCRIDASPRLRPLSRLLDGDHRLQERARALLDEGDSVLVLRAADPQALSPAVHADVV